MDGLALLEQHRPALEALCRQHGVERLYAFGSVVKGNFREDSDVDLLVKFDSELDGTTFMKYISLRDGLENIINREVDLLTTQQLKNRFFIAELNRTAKRIYG